MEAFEGEWTVTKFTESGEVGAVEKFKGITYHFEGGTLILRCRPKNAIKPLGRIVIDPTTKPQSIDIFNLLKTDTGIYELDGDALKICNSKDLAARPKEFKSTKENKAILIELKRVK